MRRILIILAALSFALSCDKVPNPTPPIHQESSEPEPGEESNPEGEPESGENPGQGENPETGTEPDTPQYKPLPEPFTVGAEGFKSSAGHIQGIAASEDAIYLSQKSRICKADWSGKVLLTKDVISHTGDICWWNGRLYASIAITENDDSNTPGRGVIMVFNEKLQMVKEVELDRRVDGITCMDGILYVGMGSKDFPSSNAHRINILGRFDAKTLKEVAPRTEFDYGYETTFGVQDMASDGTLVYASFYPVGSAPAMVAFDKDMKVVKTFNDSASNGLDLMPEIYSQGEKIFIKSTSNVVSSPKSVSCDLSYWTPQE